MKSFFKNSLRKNSNKSNDDGISVDDSSLYTTGIHSRVGGGTLDGTLSVSTKHTTISQEFQRMRGGHNNSNSNNNKSRSVCNDSISAISGLHSLDEYSYSHVGYSQQAQAPKWSMPSHRAKFVGGPLAEDNVTLEDDDETPPLTPIHSNNSSARSVPLSVTSFRSNDSSSFSFEARQSPTKTTPLSSSKKGGLLRSAVLKGSVTKHKMKGVALFKSNKTSFVQQQQQPSTAAAENDDDVLPSFGGFDDLSHDEPSVNLSRNILKVDCGGDCSSSPVREAILPPAQQLTASLEQQPSDDAPTPRAANKTQMQASTNEDAPTLLLPSTNDHDDAPPPPPRCFRPYKEPLMLDSDSPFKLRRRSSGQLQLSLAAGALVVGGKQQQQQQEEDDDVMDISDPPPSPPMTPSPLVSSSSNMSCDNNDDVIVFDDELLQNDQFCKKYNDDNDDDDDYFMHNSDHDESHTEDDEESTLAFDHGSKLNISDEDLMDSRYGSPGQLRLTVEGLTHHTEQRAQENIKECQWYTKKGIGKKTGFEAWRRQREEKKFYQDKFKEKDETLERKMEYHRAHARRAQQQQEQRGSAAKEQQQDTTSTRKQEKSGGGVVVNMVAKPLHLLSSSRHVAAVEEGVDQTSLAPMDTYLDTAVVVVDSITATTTAAVAAAASPKPSKPLPFSFGSSRNKKLTAQKLLEMERAKQQEAEAKKKENEVQEFARIQRRREEYLVIQRAIEASAKKERELEAKARRERKLMRDAANQEMAMPVLDEDSTAVVSLSASQSSTTIGGGATTTCCPSISEETTFSLDTKASDLPCIMCREGERTHIAMPCMHYSFCEDCVAMLQSRRVKTCPCCNANNVSFTKVFF